MTPTVRTLHRVGFAWMMLLPAFGTAGVNLAYGVENVAIGNLYVGWIVVLAYLALMSRLWRFPTRLGPALRAVLAVPLQVALAAMLVGDGLWDFFAGEYLVEVGGLIVAAAVVGLRKAWAERRNRAGFGGPGSAILLALALAWWLGIGKPVWLDDEHTTGPWLAFNLTALATSAWLHARTLLPVALPSTASRAGAPPSGALLNEGQMLAAGFAAWAALAIGSAVFDRFWG